MSTHSPGKTFLLCHGAWGGGWSWKKMHPLMQAAGHRLLTPTYTGLGERAHLANREVDLETHIQDILNVITYEDLRDFVLLGHSYGGMVATGVADREAERVTQIVYLDAFVPEDGQSTLDFQSPEERERLREVVDRDGAGWLVPPTPLSADLPPERAAWLKARRMPQPLRTFEEPIRLTGAGAGLPRSYIYCIRKPPGDAFASVAARCKNDPTWQYREIDSDHTPNANAPDRLADLIDELITARR